MYVYSFKKASQKITKYKGSRSTKKIGNPWVRGEFRSQSCKGQRWNCR